MREKKWFNVSAIVFGIILVAFVGILSFFIVHDAEWLIGDDAIVINRTGWDVPFSIWDTIKPELGRFFPLSYMHENIVLFFTSEMHSALQHYYINAALFIILTLSLIYLLWQTIKPNKLIDLCMIFFAVVLCVSRFYIMFLNVYSTTYFYLSLLSLSLVFLFAFYTRNNTIFAILSLCCFLYSAFCGEKIFVVSLVLGLITLFFGYKQLNIIQKYFNIGLVGISVTFLGIYFFGIFLQKEGNIVYDPSHGTGITFLENTINILKGQKFLLFAAIVWLYRQIQLLRKEDSYHIIYDSLLWTAGANLVANLILRLNWQSYYYPAIIVALPAVVYFLNKYFGKIVTLIIIMLFAALHSYKIPHIIKSNQKDRTENKEFVSYICDKYKQGDEVVWYDLDIVDPMSYDLVLREWKKNSLRTYIQFELKDKKWQYTPYEGKKVGIILYPQENNSQGNKPPYLNIEPLKVVCGIELYEFTNCE